MTQAPHVLYLAWGFPPSRGSGVYRALATGNALVGAGFETTVLTCERETFLRHTLADPSLEAKVDPRIEVVRIPFQWPLMDADIRRWPRERARQPNEWAKRRVEEDQKGFPETTYGPWLEPLVEAAASIHARKSVDLVIATANPNVSFAAAHRLFEQHGIPFVLDQRDSWAIDIWDGSVTEDARIAQLEAKFVADAQEVWFVNEPLRDAHAERYPSAAHKIYAVANGYDEELAPEPVLAGPAPERPLTFGFIGTLTPRLPLREFGDGWREARSRDADLGRAVAKLWGHLGFFAVKDLNLGELLEEYAAAGVEYGGPLKKTEVRAVFEQVDVLLLILGAGRFVTSGKVYEYMASALPIVSVQEPGGDAARVLEGYPLWFPANSLTADSIAAALIAAGKAAREATADVRRACRSHAAGYERSRQLGPRVAALLDFVAEAEARR